MAMNPAAFQILNMIRNGGNPQQLVLSMLTQRAGNNPILQNLVSLAQNNQTNDIENVARNLMQQQGLDFDKEFSSFKQNLGL